jgi:hypothetical protein
MAAVRPPTGERPSPPPTTRDTYDDRTVIESADPATTRTIEVVTDARRPLLAQVPTVHLHSSLMTALGLSDFTLGSLSDWATGKACGVWAVGKADESWSDCPTPWHRSVRVSNSAWRALGTDEPLSSNRPVALSFPLTRLPVKGVLVEQLIADNEIGLHRDDAARFGISEWAVVNYSGVPAVCRVRRLSSSADLGFVRLTLYGRVLLGVPSWSSGLRPEILISPYPADERGRPLLIAPPPWVPTLAQRASGLVGTWADRICTSALRAPSAVIRTVEATPGEDQALTVRLPAEMFPLLGTFPGKQVYVEWGPGNRAIATALASPSSAPNAEEFPDFQVVGDRLTHAPALPASAQIRIGAATRATLGIPRIAVVTVRRRVLPLIVGRLNELIVPVTGLFIGIAASVHLRAWVLALGIVIILMLLLAPLRIRRPDLRRVR